MKTLLTPAILLIAMALTFTSCNKDDDTTSSGNNSTSTETKTQLLTARYWKITAYTVTPAIDFDANGNFITDIYSTLEPCQIDNLYKFNEDYSLIDDEGNTKCDPSDSQTSTYEWSWDSTQSIITIDGANWIIMDLNTTTFKIKRVDESYNGNNELSTYSYIITFTRQ